MNNLLIYLGIYILLLLVISFYVGRNDTKEDFLIGGRDRSWRQILLSKFAAAVGASWFITYTAYAYEFGFGVLFAIIGFIVGYILFAVWAAPKIYKDSRAMSFYTQGDYVAHQLTSPFIKKLTNGLAVVTQFIWLVIGVVGGSKIISHFGLLSYELAMVCTILVVFAYIFLAGYKAVVLTDVFQSLIIVLLLVFLSGSIIGNTDITAILATQTGTMEIGTAIGFLLYGVLSMFAQPDRYQLCYAAKSAKTVTTGIARSIIPIIFISSFLLLIGLFVYSQNPTLDPAIVFIEALKTYVAPGLLPFGIVLFFAGLMSSADTVVYAIASHSLFTTTNKPSIQHIRYTMVVFLVLTAVVSYFYRDIVGITVLAAAITVCLSIPMLYVIGGGKSAPKFVGSVVGGIIGLLVGAIQVGIVPTMLLHILGGALLGLWLGKYMILRKMSRKGKKK